jgi:enamine deaminase RidA (YjgF/YER057c/UK114 family)
MIYNTIIWDNLGVKGTFASFNNRPGSSETHAFFEIAKTELSTIEQFKAIRDAVKNVQNAFEWNVATPVLKRYFLSDAINQASLLPEEEKTAVSIVQQPPLSGAKIALWVYWMENGEITRKDASTIRVKHASCNHLYTTQLHGKQADEYLETKTIFDRYTQQLLSANCTLKDNCVRTWIYVQGVDMHYTGMVKARKENFEREGLNDTTHYIASTGIEGKYIHPESIVLMDAYAIEGIKADQITYLQGLSHLNPTIEYGVTFERATSVDYGDRKHIYLSGTASIDNKGNIVHLLDIEKQLDRTLENIEVLLAEGEASIQDLAQMIVYLRDSADYERVEKRLSEKLPTAPKVIVWAPVCRPGWLIEIEGIAIKASDNKLFDRF